MLVNAGVSAVKVHYFAIWSGILEQNLKRTLSVKDAWYWSQLAHYVGRGLHLGVATSCKRSDGPPNLRLWLFAVEIGHHGGAY